MRRVLSVFLSSILALAPWCPTGAWAAAPGPEDKEAKMKALVDLLASFSDEDYEAALSRVPGRAAKNPQLVSRGTVMKSAYTTLAGYEYRKASSKAAQEDKGRYEEAYNRVGGEALQEAGWQMDVLKWVGNAALNYWMKGGQDFMGGGGARLGAMEQSESFTETGAAIAVETTAETHFTKGQEYEQLASAAVKTDTEAQRLASRKERLKKVIELLKAVSDEDYLSAKNQAPKDETRAPQLASRAKALEAAYLALAALEREAAAKEVPGSAALAGSPASPQEAGWQMDLLKWLGNAALNYWLYGGKDLMSGERGGDPRTARVEQTLVGLEMKLADPAAGPERRADLRRQMGSAYEELAADAAEPESEAELAARKKERLLRLAELLSSVSEDEYKEALDLVPAEGAKTHLASRGKVLKSAYTTLAALEYRDAERQAPTEAGLQYTANLDRVTRESGDNLVVEPKTLKERGWGKKLLGLAAVGGVGYAVYHFHKQSHRKRGHNNPNKHHTPGCPPGKAAGPSGCMEPPPHGEAGDWSRGPDMEVSRKNASATLLADGKVLVAGGMTGTWTFLNSAEIFDPGTRRWSITGSLTQGPRNAHRAVLLRNGKVLIIGGHEDGRANPIGNQAELFDPATGTWKAAATMADIRGDGHTATLLADGRVLVAGGEGLREILATTEIFDPKTGTWAQARPMSVPRGFHQATLLPGGNVLVTGGTSVWGGTGISLASAELYDPNTGAWSPAGAMSVRRRLHAAVLLPDGEVLVAGGHGGSPAAALRQEWPTEADIYDPARGAWRPAGSLLRSHVGHHGNAAVLPAGSVLLVPNVTYGGNQTAEIYFPATGRSRGVGLLPSLRGVPKVTALKDGRILVTGGQGPGPSWLASSAVDIYDPVAGPPAFVQAGLSTDPRQALDDLRQELGVPELAPERRAEVHGRMGEAYEQLASAALQPVPAPPPAESSPPPSPEAARTPEAAPPAPEAAPEPELTPAEAVRRRAAKAMGELDQENAGRRKPKR